MKDEDMTFRAALQAEQQRIDGRAPEFALVWEAAVAGARQGKRLVVPMVTAVAAIAAIAVVGLLPLKNDLHYVDVDELLGSTSWTAPSDALLPEHRFDIFYEIPRLIESTESLEGALL